MSEPPIDPDAEIESLRKRIAKLEKINKALMVQVEKSTDQTGEAMVLFQNAIDLERKVNERTQSLETVKRDLERSNRELLAAKLAAEEATIAKSQFLATMSHEIRTPMNGLVGVLALIEDGLPAEKRKLLRTAQNCAEDLVVLINDILDFSKIEAGKMSIESVPFDAQELAESVCELHSSSAHSKGLEILCDTRPEHAFDAVGDPLRLRQVVSNLVGNAIKFTEHGEVVVALSRIQSPDGVGSRLRFEIRDTGIGISPEVQDRLFGSFSQANSSTTRKFGGTGLGLSISKRLIELMQGQIGLVSREDHGTTFWFEIPQSLALKPYADPRPLASLRGRRAAIVDTAETTCGMLERWLNFWGIQTRTSRTLKPLFDDLESIRAGKAKPFDFILVDKKRIDANMTEWRQLFENRPDHEATRTIVLQRLAASHPPQERSGPNAIYKPISISRLRECLLGETTPDVAPGPESSPIPNRIHESLRVLLVDDNITNRMIATQLFKQKHGLTSVTANNGREAIQALQHQEFDIVFMDCMMPEMDGYDASRAIREGQAGRSNRDVVIIALTANAMSGDREACIAAGMTDYLPKPIRPAALAKALDQWAGKRHVSIHDGQLDSFANISDDKTENGDRSAFDVSRLLTLYEGDTAAVAQMLPFFMESLAANLADLRAAIEDGNPDKIRFHAHRIKGSATECGARTLADIAMQMEELCSSGQTAAATALFPSLESTVQVTLQAISSFGDSV